MAIEGVSAQVGGCGFKGGRPAGKETVGKIKTPDTVGSKVPSADSKELENTLSQAAKTLGDDSTSLKFEVHKATDTIMVKVIDDKTQKVIREIPSEKFLDMVASIWKLVGILLDKKA